MQLNNFGSILTFAEELEKNDEAFFSAAVNNEDCAQHKDLFDQFVADLKKNQKNIQRTRRENVTEMILEGISDFSSDSYELQHGGPEGIKASEVMETARKLEERAVQYYEDSAAKIKALPEVARELKMIAKKRKKHLDQLSEV